MAKFITSNELNSEIEKLFEKATEKLILISPYVKLHHRYESSLLAKKSNDKLAITIVFGKNEDNPSKSIQAKDIDFFKQFPRIQIRYQKRLHAKYYANENSSIITSMNLYDYSQDQNIESGILMNQILIRGLADNLDGQAYKWSQRVVEQSELIYSKEPEYEDTLLGLSKKYIKSVVKIDDLSAFFKKNK